MNNKNKKVLDCIFTDPISSKILWKDIENLLIDLNANISEGRGSRVRIELNNVLATFHSRIQKPKLT
ncbi:MAG: hypothetical protein ACI4PS_01425 [Rhodocyclaceae bacterium]